MSTFAVETKLTTINCACGGTYAIQETFRHQKHLEGGSWTCPYCQTGWGYSKNSINERLTRELAEQKRIALVNAEAAAKARQEAANALKEADHFRKQTKRIKKRVVAGVCPCCSRTVSQMARHMKTKHPNFVVR